MTHHLTAFFFLTIEFVHFNNIPIILNYEISTENIPSEMEFILENKNKIFVIICLLEIR